MLGTVGDLFVMELRLPGDIARAKHTNRTLPEGPHWHSSRVALNALPSRLALPAVVSSGSAH